MIRSRSRILDRKEGIRQIPMIKGVVVSQVVVIKQAGLCLIRQFTVGCPVPLGIADLIDSQDREHVHECQRKALIICELRAGFFQDKTSEIVG